MIKVFNNFRKWMRVDAILILCAVTLLHGSLDIPLGIDVGAVYHVVYEYFTSFNNAPEVA